MKPDWYSYSETRYTQEQVRFLIQHGEQLREGTWPGRPSDSGYTEPPQGRAYKAEGKFVKPIVIIAELDYRISQAGTDGQLLEDSICLDQEDETYFLKKMAKYLNTTEADIDSRIRIALSYCSGWKRKTVSYRRYFIQRVSYERNRAKLVRA